MLGVAAQRIAWPIRKPRNNADGAIAPKPEGTGLSGRSALSRRLPVRPATGVAPLLSGEFRGDSGGAQGGPQTLTATPTPALTPTGSCLTLNRLPAVLGEFAHRGIRAHRRPRLAGPVLHRQLEVVFAEKSLELLRAHGAQRGELVALRVVIEQDRGQRLGPRAAQHASPGCGIVDAVIGTAMDDV